MGKRLASAEAELDNLRLSGEWEGAYKLVRTFKTAFSNSGQVTLGHPSPAEVEGLRLFVQAEYHMVKGRYDECRRYALRCLATCPAYVDALLLLAKLNIKGGDSGFESKKQLRAPVLSTALLTGAQASGITGPSAVQSIPDMTETLHLLLHARVGMLETSNPLSHHRVALRIAGCSLLASTARKYPSQLFSLACQSATGAGKEGHYRFLPPPPPSTRGADSGGIDAAEYAALVAIAACDTAWVLTRTVVCPAGTRWVPVIPDSTAVHVFKMGSVSVERENGFRSTICMQFLADASVSPQSLPSFDPETDALIPLKAALGMAQSRENVFGVKPSGALVAAGWVGPGASSDALSTGSEPITSRSWAALLGDVAPKVRSELASLLICLSPALRASGHPLAALQAGIAVMGKQGACALYLTREHKLTVARSIGAATADIVVSPIAISGIAKVKEATRLAANAAIAAASTAATDPELWSIACVALSAHARLSLLQDQGRLAVCGLPLLETRECRALASAIAATAEQVVRLRAKANVAQPQSAISPQKAFSSNMGPGLESSGVLSDDALSIRCPPFHKVMLEASTVSLALGGDAQIAIGLATCSLECWPDASQYDARDVHTVIGSAWYVLAESTRQGSCSGVSPCGPVLGVACCSGGVEPGSQSARYLEKAREAFVRAAGCCVPISVGKVRAGVVGVVATPDATSLQAQFRPTIFASSSVEEAGNSEDVPPACASALSSLASIDWPIAYHSGIIALRQGRLSDAAACAHDALRLVNKLHEEQAGTRVRDGTACLPWALGTIISASLHGPHTAVSLLLPGLSASVEGSEEPLLRLLEARLAEVVSFPGMMAYHVEPDAPACVLTTDAFHILELYQHVADCAEREARACMHLGPPSAYHGSLAEGTSSETLVDEGEAEVSKGVSTLDIGLPGGIAASQTQTAPWRVILAVTAHGHVARVAAALKLFSTAHAAITAADALVDAVQNNIGELGAVVGNVSADSQRLALDITRASSFARIGNTANAALRADVLAMVGNLHEAAGNVSAAQSQYNAAVSLCPAHAPSLVRLSQTCCDQAIHSVLEVSEEWVDGGVIQTSLQVMAEARKVPPAVVLDASAILQRADGFVMQAIRADPLSSDAWHSKARIAAAQGRAQEVIDAAAQALETTNSALLVPATLLPQVFKF